MEYNAEQLYQAIAWAETGSHRKGKDNPWIRTTGSNSSAYGPVQMISGPKSIFYNIPTYNKDDKWVGGKPMIEFSDEEQKFIEKFKQQGSAFLEYGNEGPTIFSSGKEGYKEEYDYGGTGYEWSDDEKKLYKSVAKKIMAYEYKRVGKNIDKFIESWRGKSEVNDSEYYENVRDALPSSLDEIKTDNKVFNAIKTSNSFKI